MKTVHKSLGFILKTSELQQLTDILNEYHKLNYEESQAENEIRNKYNFTETITDENGQEVFRLNLTSADYIDCMKELEAFRSTPTSQARNRRILELENQADSIQYTAWKGYADNFQTKEDLYKEAKEIISGYGLYLYPRQQASCGLTKNTASYFITPEDYVKEQVVIINIGNLKKEERKEHLYKLFENSCEVKNLLYVCQMNNWDPKPIRDELDKVVENCLKRRTKDPFNDNLANMPECVILPTEKEDRYALSFFQGNKNKGETPGAYLQAFNPSMLKEVSPNELEKEWDIAKIEQYKNFITGQVEEIDTTFLYGLYSIIYTNMRDRYEQTGICDFYKPVTISTIELAQYYKSRNNVTESDIEETINAFNRYHNIRGITNERYGSNYEQHSYAIITVADITRNSITLSSYYISKIVENAYNRSQHKNIALIKHSYLIKSSINKERNKAAVINVFIIVATIEEAGSNEKATAHISAKTIIERNVQLKERLQKAKNKTQILQRTFKRTLELLRSETRLTEEYKNIKLPDPNDKKNIPVYTSLAKTVYEFRHEGKLKKCR